MSTSPSEEEAALKVKANRAEAEVAETVRREPPSSHRVYPQTTQPPPTAYTRLAVDDGPHTACTVAAGRLYGFIRLTAHARVR